MKKAILFLSSLTLLVVGLTGCDDAVVASRNLSKAADNFEIERRIVFYNGITDSYILTIQGLCSITKDNNDNQLEVTCKIGDGKYKKHYLGISDNVTYFAEQIGVSKASVSHYRVTFKPSVIVPSVNAR